MSAKKPNELAQRLAVAAIMLVVCLPLLIFSNETRLALVALVSALLLYELNTLLGGGNIRAIISLALGLTCAALAFVVFAQAIWLCIFATLVAMMLPYLLGKLSLLRVFGTATLLLAMSQCFLLAFDPWGLLYVVVLVVAVDTGAYFGGRAIGGPKLAPAISPKKTWSGAVCGILTAALAVGMLEHFAIISSPLNAGLTQAELAQTGAGFVTFLWQVLVLACASILGDLLESGLKRHLGVKDSGKLLLAHGGALDRFDGLVGALLIIMLMNIRAIL